MTTRHVCLVAAIAAVVVSFAAVASAQDAPCDPGVAHAHMACGIGSAYDAARATCSVPAATASCACDDRYRPRVANVPLSASNPCVAVAAPAVCFLPDGTTSQDEANQLCQCPAGWYAFSFDVRHSRESARALRMPRGRTARICANPLALAGAPGSTEAESSPSVAALTTLEDALQAHCGTDAEGEALIAACHEAGQARDVIGSTVGPVDLGPVMHALEELTGVAERMQRQIDGTITMITTVSNHVNTLVECIHRGRGHAITYTDSRGVTANFTCDEILAAASRDAVAAARVEAQRVVREALADGAHAPVQAAPSSSGDAGRAFVALQAYGMVTFNELPRVGFPWGIGGELSLGVSLGSGWSFDGGVGVGYAGPDMLNTTNVGGFLRLGVGAFVIPEVRIGFGGIATHRFTPNVFSAHSVYGGYVDVMIRFLPDSEWSPILTIRGFVGASPRVVENAWNAVGDGGFQVFLGAARF